MSVSFIHSVNEVKEKKLLSYLCVNIPFFILSIFIIIYNIVHIDIHTGLIDPLKNKQRVIHYRPYTTNYLVRIAKFSIND